ncbi:FHY1 [Scenedesmus sp. PABB004]|nr:FHY1 [Scenedesmus sp. PABB004]
MRAHLRGGRSVSGRGAAAPAAPVPMAARRGAGAAAGAAAAAAAPGGVAAAADGAPVLLLDVMDTIVADPFFEHMPRFFNMTFKELLGAKHPTAWVEFERGEIDEAALLARFFADGRPVDGAGLVAHMVQHYAYVPGMPALLSRLKGAGYAMHAMSNYPTWYRLIEGKLRLSDYLDWTFVSCEGPMRGLRKPAPEAYGAVTAALSLPPARCIFVDDRQPNVDAAAAAGMAAIRFTGADALEAELRALGLEF